MPEVVRRGAGRVCHGPPRRPLEPHGWAAPLQRAVAWGLLCLVAIVLISLPVLYALSVPMRLVGPMVGYAIGVALPVAVLLRALSGLARPTDVVLPIRMPDEP